MEYRELLNQNQLKATSQRVAILQAMEGMGHISIEDLFIKIRHVFKNVSLATLYKNIHTMMETGLIREVKIPGLKTRYEITKTPHAHILCKKCGSLEDLPVDFSTFSLDDMIKRGYVLEEISVTFTSICPKCH